MTFFKANKGTVYAIAMLGLSAPALLMGCSQQRSGGGTSYGTTGSRYSEPSGGGTTVAEERPGAGVGAQTSAGAAADVPEATQKGAGASDLTTPNQSGSSSSQAETGAAGAQGGASSAAPSGSAGPSQSAGAAQPSAGTMQLSRTQNSTNLAIPLYQESLQVGKREVNDGSVHIRKYVTTETVNQPVQVRRESVTVDRVPAGSQAAQGASAATAANAAQGGSQGQPFQEQDIVIQLHREEPVVSKQVQPEGQVVAQVQTQMQQTNIQGQVRREQVQVTKQGNPQNVIIGQNLASPSGSEASAMGGSSQPGGQGQGAGASSQSAADGSTITEATTLTGAQDPNSLAGRQARLSNLKVQQVLDQHLIEVSDSSGKPFYVHVNQPVQNLKPGDTVSLSGTVNRVPSDTTNLGLSDQASQALQDQSIYLDAQQLQVTGH